MISIYFGERIIRGCRSVQDCGPVLFLSRRMGNRGRIRERNEEMDQNKEEAIIRLEGLGKQFATSNGTVTALDDINLEIRRGEILVSSVFPEQERVPWCAVSTIWRNLPPAG